MNHHLPNGCRNFKLKFIWHPDPLSKGSRIHSVVQYPIRTIGKTHSFTLYKFITIYPYTKSFWYGFKWKFLQSCSSDWILGYTHDLGNFQVNSVNSQVIHLTWSKIEVLYIHHPCHQGSVWWTHKSRLAWMFEQNLWACMAKHIQLIVFEASTCVFYSTFMGQSIGTMYLNYPGGERAKRHALRV